ncbi:hypothetical protein PTNB73_08740 [Pyrenophora teres f. teres]|nr:hypothetical protein HRS9122_04785 [Pyrenophora teres f. teres]KAE8859260.1 hypothetical protein PTNB73_08740 [Pyrenophora teres f. teres]
MWKLLWIKLLIFGFTLQAIVCSNIALFERDSPSEECVRNPYCNETDNVQEWHNDCGFERPSLAVWKKHLVNDTAWLQTNLREFRVFQKQTRKIAPDETTFPAYMVKRYAPNAPSSSMLCDGLGMCRAPSCKDIGEKHDPTVKRQAMLFFEFISGLDHMYHVTNEATQDHFRHIHADIERITSTFTYADEQQMDALEKKRKKEMLQQQLELAGSIIDIVFAVVSLGTAEDQITGFNQRWLVTSNLRALEKTIDTGAKMFYDHKTDVVGFEKTVGTFRAIFTEIDMAAALERKNGMELITLGHKSSHQKDVVQLYKENFFSGGDVHFRKMVDFQIEMRSYAAILNALWKTEGVYIVESLAPNGNCNFDDRGPSWNRVCLSERLGHSYWIQAITNYDDGKIRHVPGIDQLNPAQSFHGIYLSDVVRSSIWWEEEVRLGESELKTRSSGGNPAQRSAPLQSRDKIERLRDFGNVPGEFLLPICRSWKGEAITAINDFRHTNAPCQCDGRNPAKSTTWGNSTMVSMEATKKAIKIGQWYNFKGYANMCKKDHHCKKGGSWKTMLNLSEDQKPVKEMDEAWSGGCKPKPHALNLLERRQLTDPEPAETSLERQDVVSSNAEPTRAPIVQIEIQETMNSTRWPSNNPTNIEHQGPCNGSECIIDTIYTLVERKFGYKVNSSEPLNDFACLSGDDWCVEDTAHNLCEDPSDEKDAARELGIGWKRGTSFEQNNTKSNEDKDKIVFMKEIKLVNKRHACFCGRNGTGGNLVSTVFPTA